MDAWRIMIACLLLGMAMSQPCRAEEPIALYFNDRAPYLIPGPDGTVTGLTANSATHAFKSAGIPFVWVLMPTARQFLFIQRNMAAACMVGVYRLPEREQYAKFTKAIYHNEHTVALVHDSLEAHDGAAIKDVLGRNGIRVLVKEMYSYGVVVDAVLARYKPQLVRTTNENVQMAKMIRMKQADLMFVSEEEAQTLISRSGGKDSELRILHFADPLIGPDRHIMCSRQVSDDVIEKLNQFIR
jgi:uncharacterized protein (TIGR02285 family)